MKKHSLMKFLFVALVSLVPACGAQPQREVQSPRDTLTELRSSLAQMSDDARAPTVRLEIERARSWMAEAGSAIERNESVESIGLLLELSRGQLVLIKSILERKQAEAALAETSAKYREESASLKAIREDKQSFDDAKRGPK